MLRARRSEVEERLRRLADDEQSLRHDRADGTADDEHDPEGSTLSGEWLQVEALRRAAEGEREALDAALARVDAGTYGVCVVCGRDIPLERLGARPMADRCVTCAV